MSLHESWKRTRGHLRRAHEAAGAPPLDDFREYVEHNELELAADILADYGDERGGLDETFWEALRDAFENPAAHVPQSVRYSRCSGPGGSANDAASGSSS